MSDLPVPEPTEEDERLALELIRVKGETDLRGFPEGDQRCDACHFYDDPDEEIGYCWNDRIERMVGGAWWCDRWEQAGTADARESKADQQTAARLHAELVEDQQWTAEPRFGQQCNTCLYYLNPDESVSYCWNPGLQVGVGFDHWCRWWEQIPGEG